MKCKYLVKASLQKHSDCLLKILLAFVETDVPGKQDEMEVLLAGQADLSPILSQHVATDLQVVLVSATLPHEVLEMTHKFMTDPVRVLVKRDELTLEVCRVMHALAFCHIPGLDMPWRCALLRIVFRIGMTGNQTVLCRGGARGVEVRYLV